MTIKTRHLIRHECVPINIESEGIEQRPFEFLVRLLALFVLLSKVESYNKLTRLNPIRTSYTWRYPTYSVTVFRELIRRLRN